jgi:mannose-6-phosphate isomerase-like protein (cupin superfamily)
MCRLRTVILTIKSSATKTFQWSPKTEIAAIKAWRYDSSSLMEREMVSRTPSIIDLNAEVAKLTVLRGQTPQTTPAKRKGSMARLGPYRDGILLLGTSAGTGPGHWETHPEDELIHILEGTRTLEIVCDDGPPRSFELRAGTIAVVPKGAWHRFHSVGVGTVLSAVLPGEHIDLDVDDPRTSTPGLDMDNTMRPPSIIDLNAELAKLIMCRRTPQSTMADRKGSVAQLAAYRDGLLLAIKFSGKDHWESHPGDELIHILDGTAILEIVCDDGPPKSFVLRAGTIAVIPQGAWHRFHSSEGATQMAATPFPGEHIELDVDDPRTVERKPA